MKEMSTSPSYRRYRFPLEIIGRAVWLYCRFARSYRDVEEPLAGRGMLPTYETVRRWCRKFGQQYANALRHQRPCPGDKWHMDEVFIAINGVTHYLWRAVHRPSSSVIIPRVSYVPHLSDGACGDPHARGADHAWHGYPAAPGHATSAASRARCAPLEVAESRSGDGPGARRGFRARPIRAMPTPGVRGEPSHGLLSFLLVTTVCRLGRDCVGRASWR